MMRAYSVSIVGVDEVRACGNDEDVLDSYEDRAGAWSVLGVLEDGL